MGLEKFKKITKGKDKPKSKVKKFQSVRLDLTMKPEKMQLNASKIQQALEHDMHHDPMVLQFCDEMRKADRLPELELAR